MTTPAAELDARPTLSILFPMRNEAKNLDRLFQRVTAALAPLGVSYEIVCVDDGSTDDTLARLRTYAKSMPMLRVVSLSRNFGKEIGVAAGLAHTSGRGVVLMDADLQHLPETIGDLYRPWVEGRYGIVYARRIAFDRGGKFRDFLTNAFYKVFDFMSEVGVDRETGDFMLMDRRVVDAFLQMPERHRFNRGLLAWAGFRTTTVDVETASRDGHSQWGYLKLFQLAFHALTSFGTFPLRVWTYIGSAVSLIALLYGAYILIRTMVFGSDVPGFPSLIVAILFSSGIQLIGLGIIGEYLGHVFSEVKRRPLYFVEERIGFDADSGPGTGAGGSGQDHAG